MPPPRGNAPISSARAAIRFKPSSRLKTPETQAATYSPTLWPSVTEGCTPHDAHSRANAYSNAKSAGCV